jgi:hypothetical protein
VHPFSEAIGMVASVDGDGPDALVTIVTRRGESVPVRIADVLASKDVPAR